MKLIPLKSYCKWIEASLFRVDEFIKCDEFDEKFPVPTKWLDAGIKYH